jgi:FkbM family methyltransferase
MKSLLRRAGHKLRRYILPLVGFWEILGRLEELRGRVGGLESSAGASSASLASIQSRFDQIKVELAGRFDKLAATLASETDRLAATLATTVASETDRLAATLATTVASETDLLDGYIAYHAASLQENMVAPNDLRLVLISRPRDGDIAAGLDALLLTAGYDLLVPTEEAGLISYLLRHGTEAIEPGVRAVLRHRLKPGAIAVDAGANIGIHSMAMALAVGAQGRVVCFEPLPHLAKAVEQTLRLNSLGDRARVHQMALTDTSGEVTFHRAAHGPMSSLFSLPDGLGADAIIVRTTTLDESFAPEERVDLVKMDVEGAEPLVWRGMQRVLRENADIEIILEWSSSHFRRAGEDPVAFMAEIRAAGFNPFVISDDGPASHLAPLPDGVDALEATNLLLTRRPIEQNADQVVNSDRVQHPSYESRCKL